MLNWPQLLGEKQGYMHKLDPRLKNWTRRWFVLKGKELKYYRSKVCCQGLCLSLSLSLSFSVSLSLSCSFVIHVFPSNMQESWNYTKPKGVINLAQWCRITRHEMTSSLQVSVSPLPGSTRNSTMSPFLPLCVAGHTYKNLSLCCRQ